MCSEEFSEDKGRWDKLFSPVDNLTKQSNCHNILSSDIRNSAEKVNLLTNRVGDYVLSVSQT